MCRDLKGPTPALAGRPSTGRPPGQAEALDTSVGGKCCQHVLCNAGQSRDVFSVGRRL